MAIASSLFSPKSVMDRFRSPVFIASALSLGAHGVFFAAMPMLSAGENQPDLEESVPVVALSPEEAQRLPGAVQDSGSSAFFGESPLVTQEGSLLPVPGIPPYGDLTALDSTFSEPLTTAPPLWGNPVDIFQDILPAVPGETAVIFPSDDGLGGIQNADPFSFEIETGPPVGATGLNTGVSTSEREPAITADEIAPGVGQSDLDIAEEDAPLFNQEAGSTGSGLESPLVANDNGTTIEGAFGGDGKGRPQEQAPVERNQLAAGLEPQEAASEAKEAPEPEGSALADNDPLLMANRAERQRLRSGYTKNGEEAIASGLDGEAIGKLVSEQGLALQPAESLVVQYPDPDFKCPADALPTLFNLVIQQDGSPLEPELLQSSQYPALDIAAREAMAAKASELTNSPGIYQISVSFEDNTGRCASQAIS